MGQRYLTRMVTSQPVKKNTVRMSLSNQINPQYFIQLHKILYYDTVLDFTNAFYRITTDTNDFFFISSNRQKLMSCVEVFDAKTYLWNVAKQLHQKVRGDDPNHVFSLAFPLVHQLRQCWMLLYHL